MFGSFFNLYGSGKWTHVFKCSSYDAVFPHFNLSVFYCVRETKFLPLDLIQKAYPIHQYYMTKKDWFTNNSNNFVHNWYIYISDLYITSSIWLLTWIVLSRRTVLQVVCLSCVHKYMFWAVMAKRIATALKYVRCL